MRESLALSAPYFFSMVPKNAKHVHAMWQQVHAAAIGRVPCWLACRCSSMYTTLALHSLGALPVRMQAIRSCCRSAQARALGITAGTLI